MSVLAQSCGQIQYYWINQTAGWFFCSSAVISTASLCQSLVTDWLLPFLVPFMAYGFPPWPDFFLVKRLGWMSFHKLVTVRNLGACPWSRKNVICCEIWILIFYISKLEWTMYDSQIQVDIFCIWLSQRIFYTFHCSLQMRKCNEVKKCTSKCLILFQLQ